MFDKILVAVDGSPPGAAALDTAISMARDRGGRLRLVHVIESTAYMTGYDPMGANAGALFDAVRSAAEGVLQQAVAHASAEGVPVENELVTQPGRRLGDAIADAARAWQADLVVVGTHGRSGPARLLLGSGAEQIIRNCPAPVLVVRGETG